MAHHRAGSVGSSLSSRGSSVRGGNAFGPGSSLVGAVGAGLGFAAASPGAGLAAPASAHPSAHAAVSVSPVGSFDAGGLWSNGGASRGVAPNARSPSTIGASPTPPTAAATTTFPFPFSAVDRADTPGISAEDAREMLDRLESPDGVGSAEDEDAKRVVVVRGVPDVPDAELLLYRAFAPHGALASVTVEGDREARVRFAKREEARAAARAVDGSILGGCVVAAAVDAAPNRASPFYRPSPSA